MDTKYRVWAGDEDYEGEREHWPVMSPWHGAVLIEALALSDNINKQIAERNYGLEYQETDKLWYEWYDSNDEDVSMSFGHEVYELELRNDDPPSCIAGAVASRQ